jgi:phosphoribosyl 1,2-cyclic phosphodiesterase
VEAPTRTVILDAGTGIRQLGKELQEDPKLGIDRECYIAFSHFHWDHIQGLPFFGPAYDSRRTFILTAIGRDRYSKDLRGVFATQMQEDYFPISLENMGATFKFMQTAEDSIRVENAFIRVLRHNHPGNAYSYRLRDTEGKVLVYVTDIEHGESIDQNVVELARDADLLIHDGQYTPEELPRFRGWGHSSWEQAIEVAEQANVRRLVITHHDPDHDDAMLRGVEQQCQARFRDCCLAREGMEIRI